jgi:hypothetical protein
MKNAIRVAKEYYESGINTHIEKQLSAARLERAESLISAGKAEESA